MGLYRSGKTVFLTSLINHLQNHRPDRFLLGKNARLVFAEELQPSLFERFPYSQHRDRLVTGEAWPEKTRGVYEYACRYYRSDWHFSRGELSMLDFPGERMADLMMVNATFDQWSDLMLSILRDHSEYHEPATPYLKLMDSAAVTETDLLDAYKRLLVQCFFQYRPVISPSAILISPAGDWHGEALKQGGQALNQCFCGLDADSQFVPLSAELRERYPGMRHRFSANYRNYRHKIALPLATWMRGCDALVVLIDVTTLLAGGEGMYQGNRELLRNLIDLLKPGHGYFGLTINTMRDILDPLGGLTRLTRHKLWPAILRWKNISKIAFVATKADKVHESDRDRLRELTRDMTVPIIAKREFQAAQLDVGYFACAAVSSTRSASGHQLQAYREPGTDAECYTPSHVPDNWPQTWSHGQFRFPNVRPWIPRLRDSAPDHIELDRVADFLMR